MNSDENVQKAIEASKEFQREHPEVPTVDVESDELPIPTLVRVTRELNELRAAANEISGVIGKTVDYVGENREPCTSYYPLNDFAFANAVERLRETLEKMKL